MTTKEKRKVISDHEYYSETVFPLISLNKLILNKIRDNVDVYTGLCPFSISVRERIVGGGKIS